MYNDPLFKIDNPAYHIIEQYGKDFKIQNRAEAVAIALIALYYIDKIDALFDDAIKRCEDDQTRLLNVNN